MVDEIVPKRGRGRPKKNPLPEVPVPEAAEAVSEPITRVKKRGRVKKADLPAELEEESSPDAEHVEYDDFGKPIVPAPSPPKELCRETIKCIRCKIELPETDDGLCRDCYEKVWSASKDAAPVQSKDEISLFHDDDSPKTTPIVAVPKKRGRKPKQTAPVKGCDGPECVQDCDDPCPAFVPPASANLAKTGSEQFVFGEKSPETERVPYLDEDGKEISAKEFTEAPKKRVCHIPPDMRGKGRSKGSCYACNRSVATKKVVEKHLKRGGSPVVGYDPALCTCDQSCGSAGVHTSNGPDCRHGVVSTCNGLERKCLSMPLDYNPFAWYDEHLWNEDETKVQFPKDCHFEAFLQDVRRLRKAKRTARKAAKDAEEAEAELEDIEKPVEPIEPSVAEDVPGSE